MKKRNLKKMTARIIALSTTVVTLICGGNVVTWASSETEEPVKITFWSHFGGEDGTYLNNMVKQYQELHPEVEIEHLEVTNEDYYTKFKTGIASGEGPDISTGDANRLGEFKQAGLVTDMTAYAEEAGVNWESFNKNVLDTCVIDEEHLAIPLSSYVTLMFVNKQLLEEADMLRLNDEGVVDFGSSPEEFIAFLEEYQAKKPDDVYAIVGGTSGDDPYRLWWSFYGQTGESFLNEDMTATNVNSENSKKALELISSLTEKDLWPAGMENADQVFLANKAAFYVSGNWWVGAVSESGIDYIAMPLPQIYEQPSAWGGTHVFYLNPRPGQTDEQRIEAVKFADWMASNAGEWAKAGHVPAKTEVLESEEYKSLPNRDTYESITTYMLDLPACESINAIVEVFRNNFPLAFNGQSPVEEVLANSEKEINALLE